MSTRPQPPPPKAAASPRAAAIASLVLGVVAMLLSWILIGAIFAVVGLVLGILDLSRKQAPRGIAWAGTILCAVAILLTAAVGTGYYWLYTRTFEAMTSGSGNLIFVDWQGVAAPNITVTTLEGETVSLRDLKGKRVILDFWATWCAPCVREIPHFVALNNELPDDELVIIGISKENEEVLQTFVAENDMNYLVVSQKKQLPSPYADVRAIPTTFFIDRNGIIQTVLVGYHDLEHLRKQATAPDYDGAVKAAPGGDDGEVSTRPGLPGFRTLFLGRGPVRVLDEFGQLIRFRRA